MDIYSVDNGQQEMTIDLKKYLYLVWQWSWLIVLCTLLAALAAFIISQRMTPVYQATTTVLVDVPSTGTSEVAALQASERLSRTYSEMMTNKTLLRETIDTLGMQMEPGRLAGMITVRSLPNTQLIEVQVESTNPQAAATIANTLVAIFSNEVRDLQSSRFDLSRTSIEAQLGEVEAQINETNAQLLGEAQGDARDRLEIKLAQQQQVYATLLGSYEQIRLSEAQSISTVVIYDPANVPENPVRPRPLMNTAIAGLTGFLLVTGGIFAFDALDDTLKTPDEIKEYLELPVLGIIDAFPQDDGNALIAAKKPRSPVTEEFRTLRTNVQFASIDRELKSFLVTSSEPTEGKTTIAANLAVVFAQSGRDTLLIDADLRRPEVHNRFDIGNHAGLTSLFFNPIDNPHDHLGDHLQNPFESLRVLTTGKLPPNPSEILASSKMKRIVEKIKNETEMLIIDTPPVLAVTDAVVLSPLVDGVLLVVAPGKTKITAARNTIEQLKRSQAKILGVVIKFMDGRGRRYARRYGYATRSEYERYYQSEDEE